MRHGSGRAEGVAESLKKKREDGALTPGFRNTLSSPLVTCPVSFLCLDMEHSCLHKGWRAVGQDGRTQLRQGMPVPMFWKPGSQEAKHLRWVDHKSGRTVPTIWNVAHPHGLNLHCTAYAPIHRPRNLRCGWGSLSTYCIYRVQQLGDCAAENPERVVSYCMYYHHCCCCCCSRRKSFDGQQRPRG